MFDYKQYQRNYFMPPQECLAWARKEYVDKAPVWCSVDLRDGNQALVVPMTLEQKLRDSRIGCGLSQEDLAGKVNVSRQTVSGWERGTVRPSADNLAALSEIFQIPVDALLKEDWVPPEEKGPAVQIVEVPVPRSIRWRLLVLAGTAILIVGIAIGALLFREPPEKVVLSSQLETEVLSPEELENAEYIELLPLE